MKKYQFWSITLFLIGIFFLVVHLHDYVKSDGIKIVGYGIIGFVSGFIGFLTAVIGSIIDQE